MKKQPILVSACLLGVCCRYDGACKPCQNVINLRDKFLLVPICPEVDGGLPTPRTPSEGVGQKVLMKDGKDVTDNFRLGAELALERAKTFSCVAAVLKARSPSCGSNIIYDGSFSGTLTEGDGVAAKRLKENGIDVFTEDEIDKLLEKYT